VPHVIVKMYKGSRAEEREAEQAQQWRGRRRSEARASEVRPPRVSRALALVA
jgi:hypothetical protein